VIYFNFLHCPDGGGYQNSLSFITTLIETKYNFDDVTCIVFEGTSLEKILKINGIKYQAVKKGVISKTLLELKLSTKITKRDLVFSIFGPPILFTKGKSINIGGMAISNVFHKDINFWGYLPLLKKFTKKCKDRYRVKRYIQLDYWVFETELLLQKAVEEFNFPVERCEVIKMTPSHYVKPNLVNGKTNPANDIQNIKFLFLAGGHPNKRLHLLPNLAQNLMKVTNDFRFYITADSNAYLENVLLRAKELNVADKIALVGKVDAEKVVNWINDTDIVCNFSLLESFSNNFVEAWAMEKPLLVTDAIWSRRSCKNAAIYIDLEDLEKGASQIGDVIKNKKQLKEVIENGLGMLREHPSASEKAVQYVKAIEKASALGKIKASQRNMITL